MKPKKGDIIEVTWWDHTYSIDDHADPAELVTIGRYFKTKTKKKKKYILMYGEWEKDQKAYEYTRHHYTILCDDISNIRKVEQ